MLRLDYLSLVLLLSLLLTWKTLLKAQILVQHLWNIIFYYRREQYMLNVYQLLDKQVNLEKRMVNEKILFLYFHKEMLWLPLNDNYLPS